MAELNPELQLYKTYTGGMRVIRHPLVYAVPYHDVPFYNELLNQQFEMKSNALKRAILDKEWSSFVFLHERPYRQAALSELITEHDLPKELMYELLLAVWVDSENIWENAEWWRKYLLPLAGKDVWNRMHLLPERIFVHRGGSKNGLSWTSDPRKAEWFAKRFAVPTHQGWVHSGQIMREHVIAYVTERGEKELILDPSKLFNRSSYKV